MVLSMDAAEERLKPPEDSPLEPRPHAVDIYERVCDDTIEELRRPPGSLVFSGLFAGFTIALAPLAYALTLVALGDGNPEKFVAALLYPIGYIAVIIGRAQFFTENTLYPVMVTMRRPEYLRVSTRLWAIVYATNLAGALLFAALAIFTGAFGDPAQANLVAEGVGDTSGPLSTTFWSAVVTGWLLALVAWLVEASEHAIGQIAVIYAITLVVGLGGFDHCIATTVEAFCALFEGPLALDDLLGWLAVTTAGNVVGGVMIVAAINYGQVRRGGRRLAPAANPHRVPDLGEGRRGNRPCLFRAGLEDALELALVAAQVPVALAGRRQIGDDLVGDRALEVAVAGCREVGLDLGRVNAPDDREDLDQVRDARLVVAAADLGARVGDRAHQLLAQHLGPRRGRARCPAPRCPWSTSSIPDPGGP